MPSVPKTPVTPPAAPGKFATPDVTLAQLASLLTFIVSQAVAWGWIHDAQGQRAVAIGGILLPIAWHFADSIIRHGRATGSANK
jgi:hypothetical protein